MYPRQHLLQVEAAHVGHLKIEDDTGGTGIELLAEKLSSRRIGSDLTIMGTKKSFHRAADAQIVVDNVNCTFRHGPAPWVFANWRLTWSKGSRL
jgi:hypothetical protein